MIKNFDVIKSQLSELAPIINGFKSEAVQLKIIELVLTGGEDSTVGAADKIEGKKRRRKTATRKPKEGGETNEKASPNKGKKEGKRTGSSGRPGPLEMLNTLIAESYFNKKRSLNEILVHLKEKYAYIYRNNDFSPTLGRAVRSKLLKREKNAEGQYEYTKI
jgi:hypothetical protein